MSMWTHTYGGHELTGHILLSVRTIGTHLYVVRTIGTPLYVVRTVGTHLYGVTNYRDTFIMF